MASASARFTGNSHKSELLSFRVGFNGDELAVVLFPTPPFPLPTTITLDTCGIAVFTGGPPRRGMVGAGFD
jgi:hypothetical protein